MWNGSGIWYKVYDATVAALGKIWCYSSCVILLSPSLAFTFRFVLSVDRRQITKNAFGMRMNVRIVTSMRTNWAVFVAEKMFMYIL